MQNTGWRSKQRSDPVLSLSDHIPNQEEAGLDFRLTLAFVVIVETIEVILPQSQPAVQATIEDLTKPL